MSSTVPQLRTSSLGKNGPQVPRLGLGFVGLAGHYGAAGTDEERLAFLDEVYKRGETFWDTADEYNDCEDIIGKWFKLNPDKRKDIFLATKFAIRFSVKEDGTKVPGVDSTPEYCKQAIERSLKRLGVPFVDLYYIHRLDLKTPIEKTMEAMVELKNAGKIKHIGLSECSAESLRRAYKIHPIACVQVEYNLFCLAIEDPKIQVLKVARELRVAIVAYCPLGHGFITGALRTVEDFTKPGDQRKMVPWLSNDNLEENVAVVDKLTAIAKVKGATTAQLALAWLLAQGGDIFPIPGTRNIGRLEENLGSLDISLSQEEEKAVRKISEGIVGGRVQNLFGEGMYCFADTPAF